MEESKNKEIQAVRDELMEKGDNLKQYKSKLSFINQVHYQVVTAHIHFNKRDKQNRFLQFWMKKLKKGSNFKCTMTIKCDKFLESI